MSTNFILFIRSKQKKRKKNKTFSKSWLFFFFDTLLHEQMAWVLLSCLRKNLVMQNCQRLHATTNIRNNAHSPLLTPSVDVTRKKKKKINYKSMLIAYLFIKSLRPLSPLNLLPFFPHRYFPKFTNMTTKLFSLGSLKEGYQPLLEEDAIESFRMHDFSLKSYMDEFFPRSRLSIGCFSFCGSTRRRITKK